MGSAVVVDPDSVVEREAIDVTRYQPAVEIKSATFTELRVWQDEEAVWHAQCVVDV